VAARTAYDDTLDRNARIRHFAIAGIVFGLLVVALVGHMFIRGIVNPLNASIRRLNRIAQGDLQGEIDLSGTGESGQLNHAAAVMQLHLKVMIDEIALAARRIHRHCATLNIALYEVTEHSEEQHDRVYSAIRSLDAAVAETSDLSERAERLMHLAPACRGMLAGAGGRHPRTGHRHPPDGLWRRRGGRRHAPGGRADRGKPGEAQRAWQASEELKRTAVELNQLVDISNPPRPPAGAAWARVPGPALPPRYRPRRRRPSRHYGVVRAAPARATGYRQGREIATGPACMPTRHQGMPKPRQCHHECKLFPDPATPVLAHPAAAARSRDAQRRCGCPAAQRAGHGLDHALHVRHLQIEEWLQWVFVPRLHALIDGGHALPGECSVQPLAEHEWTQRTVPQHQAALRQLALIDALLSAERQSRPVAARRGHGLRSAARCGAA
jgi:hypothetical protein